MINFLYIYGPNINNMEELRFKIKKVGTLHHSRLEGMSIFRKELNLYGYNYTIIETKLLIDTILCGEFNETFHHSFIRCLDTIFEGVEYFNLDEHLIEEEFNFPDGWVPPIGGIILM